ncbi:MAG: hypothetical protein KAI66_12670 [Lentisphaeria bacterium]|nr:hypothetical protein [Lentisphaeria bacterium]
MQEQALNILREIAQRDQEGATALLEQLDLKEDIGKQLEDLGDEFKNSQPRQESDKLREGFQEWAAKNREQTLEWLATLDVEEELEAEDLFSAAIESLATDPSAWRDNLLDVFSAILKRVEKAEEIEGSGSDEFGECPELVGELIRDIIFLDNVGESDEIGPDGRALGQFLEPWLGSPSVVVRQEVASTIGAFLDTESSFLPRLVDMARGDPEYLVRQTALQSLRFANLLPEDLQPSALRRFFKSLPIIGWFINE